MIYVFLNDPLYQKYLTLNVKMQKLWYGLMMLVSIKIWTKIVKYYYLINILYYRYAD
jgi:hypothetical protein